MENGTSFFEEKINSFDMAFIELRSGSWARGLTKGQWKEQYYGRYRNLLSEFETTLSPKLLPDEKEQLEKLKRYLNDIKQKRKEEYIVDDDSGNGEEVWTNRIDYNKGILILKNIEALFRKIVERLSTKSRTH